MGQQLKIGDKVTVTYKCSFIDIKNATGTISELTNLNMFRVILDHIHKTTAGNGTISRLLLNREEITLLNPSGNSEWISDWDNN